MARIKRCQIAFDIDEKTKYQVKEMAARKMMTMNMWLHLIILAAILKQQDEEKSKNEKK